MDRLSQYLKWRPLMTSDGFWVAILKSVPYEVTSAYAIIRGAYAATAQGNATVWLFWALVVLAVFVVVLHRSTTGATITSSIILAVVFFLLTLSIDVTPLHDWLVDATTTVPYALRYLPWVINQVVQPFPLLVIAVLLVLASSTWRGILGKPS